MRITSSLLAVSALAACAFFASGTIGQGSRAKAADSCGNSGTWRETKREGGECCMPEHTHYGAGHGATKAAALASAADNWADLVDFEYGSAFSHFGLAHGKSVSCSNGSGWTCNVEARPCRRG